MVLCLSFCTHSWSPPRSTEDSFDLYYGLYKYNPAARTELDRLEASFAAIRAKLEACEAAEAAQAAGQVTDKPATPVAVATGKPMVLAAADTPKR